ncbi:MAG: hypothetical protein HY510_03350, partial [Acidobacteria bacterium]|nr:hypothetical protein [Acidobacteriota bacterium]
LFAVAACGFFLKALETGRWRDHLAWGAALGLGFWTYTAFRAIPLAFGTFLLLRRFFDREGAAGRRAPRQLLAGAAGAALCLALLMAWSPVGPDGKDGGVVHRALGFVERGAYATVVTPQASRVLNLLFSLTLINYFPARYAVIQSPTFISDGVSPVYGLAGCEPETIVVAALATLGLLYAGWRALSKAEGRAARRRHTAGTLVLLCYLAVILTVGLAGPSLTRLLVNLPWICLFAALFTSRLFAAVAAIRRPLTAWAGAAAIAGIVSLACADGYGRHFLRAGRSDQAMQHFGPTQTIMGMFVRSEVPPDRLTYVLHTLRVDALKYLIGDRPALHLVTDPRHLDLDSIIRMPRTVTFIVENARPFAEALRYLITRYPQGDMTQIADARFDPDTIIFYTFTLWKDASGQPMSPPGARFEVSPRVEAVPAAARGTVRRNRAGTRAPHLALGRGAR